MHKRTFETPPRCTSTRMASWVHELRSRAPSLPAALAPRRKDRDRSHGRSRKSAPSASRYASRYRRRVHLDSARDPRVTRRSISAPWILLAAFSTLKVVSTSREGNEEDGSSRILVRARSPKSSRSSILREQKEKEGRRSPSEAVLRLPRRKDDGSSQIPSDPRGSKEKFLLLRSKRDPSAEAREREAHLRSRSVSPSRARLPSEKRTNRCSFSEPDGFFGLIGKGSPFSRRDRTVARLVSNSLSESPRSEIGGIERSSHRCDSCARSEERSARAKELERGFRIA